MQTILGR
jgi:hypothetical protein